MHDEMDEAAFDPCPETDADEYAEEFALNDIGLALRLRSLAE